MLRIGDLFDLAAVQVHDVQVPDAVAVGSESESRALGAESRGDVVPFAGGDAGERVAVGLEGKEVGVAVLFDGKEDALAFAEGLGGQGRICDLRRGLHRLHRQGFLCRLGAGKEEQAEGEQEARPRGRILSRTYVWKRIRHGEGWLFGIRFGVGLRRGDFKGQRTGFVGRSIGIKQAHVEGEGVDAPAANMQGEFDLPTHGFDDAGGGHLLPFAVDEGDFDVRPFLEGGDLKVDPHAARVGPGFGGDASNARLFGHGAGEVVFGEEKFHGADYTLRALYPAGTLPCGLWALRQAA